MRDTIQKKSLNVVLLTRMMLKEMVPIPVYLEQKIDDSNIEYIEIIQNNNTLRTELKCTNVVDLTVKNSIALLMRFKPAILKKIHLE